MDEPSEDILSLILERVVEIKNEELTLVKLAVAYKRGEMTAVQVAIELHPLSKRELIAFYRVLHGSSPTEKRLAALKRRVKNSTREVPKRD